MKNGKLIGLLLIIASLFMISGIIIKNDTFWSFADIIVILICLGSGSYLLLQKKIN